MWKKIRLVLAVLVLVLVVVIAMQPAHYTITRSSKMNAAPEAVFVQFNNFHNC
jgi:hypothetical protein